MKWTLINPAGTNDPDTGDIYSGLDRFGRVKDNRWLDGEGADLDRIQYGYDRAGNRIWRRNVVAAALGKEFDELYGYDGVHRLQDMARGTLNGGRTALTAETFAQCWTLDSTGNWQGFREDGTGNGTWDLVQQRSANAVNEINGITETTGPSWVTPAYSRAGNMTTLPQPADPTQSYAATYDAWNRLVKLADGSDTVSECAYDGARRRIVQKSYAGGVLDETRHLYYTQPSSWQVLEERLGTSPDSADAERQFVWGLRYVDDLALRDRDTDANGTLDERLYALQDANWNVTAVTDNAEDVQERYAYEAYGTPTYLSASFVPQSTTFDWETLYCGYKYYMGVGIFHVRSRDYLPVTGTWLLRDSSHWSTWSSLYAYCNSCPTSLVDPFGYAASAVNAQVPEDPFNPGNPNPNLPDFPPPGETCGLLVVQASSGQGTQTVYILPLPSASDGGDCSRTQMTLKTPQLVSITPGPFCLGANPPFWVGLIGGLVVQEIKISSEPCCPEGQVCCPMADPVTTVTPGGKFTVPAHVPNSLCVFLVELRADIETTVLASSCVDPGLCCPTGK